MPYKSFPQGDQHCVYKIDGDGDRTGKSLGCHDSKSEADSQVRALYASENKSKAPDEVIELIKSKPSTTGFVVYKSADNKQLRWLARFSNNIRDDDYPVKEIISAEAHRKYEYVVNKQLVPPPQLWVWHEKDWNIGETDWVATDEVDGLTFSLASGVIHPHAEDVAVSLGKMDGLAMSHGMVGRYIERDEKDTSIITGFVSAELSVLPKWSAANKHTTVYVLDSTENTKMIKTEKRTALENSAPGVGDLLDLIQEQNAVIAEQAKNTGLETKEAGEENEEEEVSTTEASKETSTDDAAEETDTETDVEVKEESEEEVEEDTEDDNSSKGVSGVDRDELVAVLKTLGGRLGDIEKAIVNIGERVESIEEAETRRKEQPLATSLVDLISGGGESIGSVIGNEKAKADGRKSLARSKPEETEDKSGKGLFFEEFLSR